MSYVGNTPAEKYLNIAVQHFSTSATTSYTLNQSVGNENEIALFINNVRQQPGSSYSYTASGTTLTLSQATAGSDTMYCVFLGKTVGTVDVGTNAVNTAQIVDNAVTSAKIVNNAITTAKITDANITTAKILNDAVDKDKVNFVSTSSSAGLEVKGDGTTDGYLQLNCNQNTHGIKLKSPPHSASATYTLTFPNNDGNTSQFLQTNGSGVLTWADAGGGGYASNQVFTASGTWTKPTGVKLVKARVQGAGGGGGGCAGGQNNSDAGSAGGYCEETIDVSGVASVTVTVGAGGTAGASGNNNGGDGATSSFGTYCTATGGSGGYSSDNSNGQAYPRGNPGTGTGGDFNVSGGWGGKGSRQSESISSMSGSSYFGGGASGSISASGGNAGQSGSAYGSGGGSAFQNPTDAAGGAGKAGIVIIEEYK